MDIPLPMSMQRLIAKQKANGSAVFRDFVQAMTPVFAEMERLEAMKLQNSQETAESQPRPQAVEVPQEQLRRQNDVASKIKRKLQQAMEISSHGVAHRMRWNRSSRKQEILRRAVRCAKAPPSCNWKLH